MGAILFAVMIATVIIIGMGMLSSTACNIKGGSPHQKSLSTVLLDWLRPGIGFVVYMVGAYAVRRRYECSGV